MPIIIGHASIDERGKINGGALGDQTNKEVCTRSYYMHSKGWYLLRPKSTAHANAIAEAMLRACNNPNIGYDQYNRLGVITHGTNSNIKTECDCSSLVRQCVIEGTNVDAGNFTTANEKTMLSATGLFENAISVTSSTIIYNGDILVTKTKGHTAIVVSGNSREAVSITTTSSSTYTRNQCVKDIQAALGGLTVDGLCGTKTLAKLPTISKTKNSKHKIVQYVQRYLNSLGYECGTADSVFGAKTHNAVALYQKRSGLVADGIIGKNTWKKLIGM